MENVPKSSELFNPIVPEIAYFCMEFAVKNDFHIYSGGLGVLAGDYLLQCAEEEFPAIGVGLLYTSSIKQEIAEDNSIKHIIDSAQPEDQELELITDDSGQPIQIAIPLFDSTLKVQAWVKEMGSIKLLLLDTKIPENTSEFQSITDALYAGNKDHRLLQEIVLGIGGTRFLKTLGLTSQVIHMNEGHAGFCVFELIYQTMQSEHIGYTEALAKTTARLVFSNHTLIPAGNDFFSLETCYRFFEAYARETKLEIDALLSLGKTSDNTSFSMTALGLQCASKINAVSVFHAEKAKELWPDHPLKPITNGIYLPRWISPEKAAAWPIQNLQVTDQEMFWHAHQENKESLLHEITKRTNKRISSQALILTWSRRFVQYKRPEALFWNLDWLARIIQRAPIPIHFVFSGKAHAHDSQAQQMIQHVVELSSSERFSNALTYLPNYNLDLASYLVRGSDVWLNTPVEGYEACGTSGMKAALNGVLQCSTNDGWVREVNWSYVGWILDSSHISESLYNTIEDEIIPLYTQRDSRGVPREWVSRMIKSSQIIRDQYSTKRMLRDYDLQLYRSL